MSEERVIAVAADGSQVDVTEAVQVVFDAVIGSMDFGSGFLDTFEVIALRRLAEALGVDPKDATPSQWNSVKGETLDGKHYQVSKSPEWIGRQRAKGYGSLPIAGRVKCACGWSYQVPVKVAEWPKPHEQLAVAYRDHLALAKGSVA